MARAVESVRELLCAVCCVLWWWVGVMECLLAGGGSHSTIRRVVCIHIHTRTYRHGTMPPKGIIVLGCMCDFLNNVANNVLGNQTTVAHLG